MVESNVVNKIIALLGPKPGHDIRLNIVTL